MRLHNVMKSFLAVFTTFFLVAAPGHAQVNAEPEELPWTARFGGKVGVNVTEFHRGFNVNVDAERSNGDWHQNEEGRMTEYLLRVGW